VSARIYTIQAASGERMKPTARAVGKKQVERSSPARAKERLRRRGRKSGTNSHQESGCSAPSWSIAKAIAIEGRLLRVANCRTNQLNEPGGDPKKNSYEIQPRGVQPAVECGSDEPSYDERSR
jgi:hypothetical protein